MKLTLPIILVALFLTGAACTKNTVNQNTNQAQTSNTNAVKTTPTDLSSTAVTVSWSFNGSDWTVSGTPPACPSPLAITSPVDVSLASAILYPGQSRGGNYKPHGGFRFDGKANTAITVRAPLDGVVYNASRYIEAGETQYLITFIHPCGLMYRFDHLLTLSPAMQAVADTLPAAQVDDSRTTNITSGISVKAGDVIATAVGFKKTSNVSVDFGLYDLRSANAAAADATYARSHGAEYDQHAVCWLSLLPTADATKVQSLPAGDQTAGKTSDYCK